MQDSTDDGFSVASALGEVVRARREELGLTQQTAATSAPMAVRTWSAVEAGRPCNVGTLERIARVLELTLAELLSRAETIAAREAVAS